MLVLNLQDVITRNLVHLNKQMNNVHHFIVFLMEYLVVLIRREDKNNIAIKLLIKIFVIILFLRIRNKYVNG